MNIDVRINRTRLIKVLFLSFWIGLGGSAAEKAQALVSDPLLQALPSPLAYLSNTDRAGAGLQKALLEGIGSECKEHPLKSRVRLSRGCQIPPLIGKYTRLLQKLHRGENGVVLSSEGTVKPWDLSAIVAGQFIIVPDPSQIHAGRELLVDLFLVRDQAAQAINDFYFPPTRPKGASLPPRRSLAGLFLRSYVLTSSPLGALAMIYQGHQCGFKERSCEVLKSLWGAVCHIAIENHDSEFEDLRKRLNLAMGGPLSLSLDRLKYVQSLQEYIQKGNLDRSLLLKKLEELEGEGQAGFADVDYMDLALAVLVYNELKQVIELKSNCLAYSNELSEKIRLHYKKQLYAITKKNIENIENALVKYGVMNESGGL